MNKPQTIDIAKLGNVTGGSLSASRPPRDEEKLILAGCWRC